jgi:predicted P-loop ATPase
MTPEQWLRANGIVPPKHGRYTVCPKCSSTRKGAHKKLKCLGVTIDGDNVRWGCNHCGWTGPERGTGGNGERPPLKCYLYGDSLRKVRNSPGRIPKCFWQHLNGSGGEWEHGTGGVKTAGLLYRFDEVREAIAAGETIAVVEGERDVDSLWRIGIAATCNAHGASEPDKEPKWKPAHSKQLAGARLVVLNDNDAAGYAHAKTIVTCSRGIAKEIRRLDLIDAWPDIGQGNDVSDWLANGGTPERLLELIEAAPVIAERKSKPPEPVEGWRKGLLCNGRAIPYSSLANVMIALRSDPAFAGALEFDEMAQDAILLRNVPLVGNKPAPDTPRPITDDDVSRLQEWLQHNGLPQIGRDVCGQAMHLRAREVRRHPVRDWLNGLEWKGIDPRLDTWLATYLGAQGDPGYLAVIGSMFIIAMVARIFQPGCQADYMPVLEGPQGIEKSKACRALAREYFSDSLPENISSKDARQHLRGKWLVEIAELAAFTKAATEPLKAFITRRGEKYRPPYGAHEVEEPRQCLFIGTTNKPVYIKDETGGRRFWPVKCGRIDVEKLEDDRDQLFAEAVHRYRQREQWWPDRAFEQKFIQPEQTGRTEVDPWFERIAEYVAGKTEAYMLAILQQGLDLEVSRVDPVHARRVAAVLYQLEWAPGKRDKRGVPYRPRDALV